jgi:G3E family GTPase
MHQEEKMVELSNGCICCTLREDLLTSITNLATENRFDHVLVESSGISEPLPVAETFTFTDKATGVSLNAIASLHNLVTVIDAASIFEQFNTLDMLTDRGWQAGEGDRRTVPQLLCEQLEFADVLIVNKADLVSEMQLGKVVSLVKRINPKAEVMRTTHSTIDPALLLDKARFSMQQAEEHPDWLKEAREHEHTPETVEYGISSFIFRARVPFHPERLHVALGGHPRVGALQNLLRLKGFAWLAPWSSRQGVAALAGTQFTLAPGNPWWASVKREHWPPGLKEDIQTDWHEQHGDRRTELVCIGQDLDHEAAQAVLETCLLTEVELAAGQTSWFSLRDPFFETWDADQRAAGARGTASSYEHGQHAETVTHVLVLHETEGVPLRAAIGVMGQAGIGTNIALPLLRTVGEQGQGIVAQGREEDMQLLAGLFAEVGMKTTIQQGSVPHTTRQN